MPKANPSETIGKQITPYGNLLDFNISHQERDVNGRYCLVTWAYFRIVLATDSKKYEWKRDGTYTQYQTYLRYSL
jgi:hypothetical protein